MILVAQIDVSALTVGGRVTVDLSKSPQVSASPRFLDTPAHVLINNESGTGFLLAFQTSGYSTVIPAGQWATLPIVPGESGLLFTASYVITNPPVTTLFVTYYAPGETLPVSGILGNSPIGGTTAVTIASLLQNLGNVGGTQVIQLAQSGSTSSNVLVYNDGTVTVGEWNGTTFTKLFQIVPNASPSVLIGATGVPGKVTSILGDLDVESNINGVNGFNLNTPFTTAISADALGDTLAFNVLTNGTFSVGGTNQFRWSSTGVSLLNGTIGLLHGSISRVSVFTASVTTTPTNFNHGLGAVPDFVVLQPKGGISTSRTVMTENYTSSQIEATGNSSFVCDGLAIKL